MSQNSRTRISQTVQSPNDPGGRRISHHKSNMKTQIAGIEEHMADRGIVRPVNWTIMVYIAADDTLADFAVRSLKQLKDVAAQNPDIVVAAHQ